MCVCVCECVCVVDGGAWVSVGVVCVDEGCKVWVNCGAWVGVVLVR